MARCRAWALLTGSWARMVSMIWSPMRKTGLREVIGSWKIIPMDGPRNARSSLLDIPTISCPSNRIEPEAIRPGGSGSNPRIESAVTLLPDPLSPTIPKTSPGATSKLRPSTAGKTPASVRKVVVSALTDSKGGCISFARSSGAGPTRRAAHHLTG